jgi:hypothetical protein
VLAEQGTLARFSCPGAHTQNRVAERKHRHQLEIVRALMIASSVLPQFWAEVVSTVTYLINIQPYLTLQGGIPFERITPAFVFLIVCAMCFLCLVSTPS